MHVTELPTPALLVDLDRLERNIDTMARRARELDVRLRPHVKTHKCIEVGRLQQRAGAAGITAATLFEAEAFAAHGFDDITWALPVSLSRLKQVDALARRIHLGVVVDSLVAVDALATLRAPLRVWLKVDCGYHRCGVDPDGDAIARIADRVAASGLQFAGLLSHSGNAYDHAGRAERAAVAEQERATMVAVASRLRGSSHVGVEVSVGSTPAMTAVATLVGVDEARPGNYAYFDRMQLSLGSCELQECALTVMAQVVSAQATHAVIDAGALALSKDVGAGDRSTMGDVFIGIDDDELDPDLRVVSLSQEHGKLSRSLPVGTRVRVLPNHSCLTAACFDRCWAVRGDRVVERWQVHNGRDT